MGRRRLTCEEVLERLDDYLDRELAPSELERLREHLASCDDCASELAAKAHLVDVIRQRLRQLTPPPNLMDKIAAALAADTTRGPRHSH